MKHEFYLIEPNLEHETSYTEMINTWDGEKIVPEMLDSEGKTYHEWLSIVNQEKNLVNSHKVPSTTYFLMHQNEIIGAVNIRHFLNERLLQVGGNIGYGIKPPARGKGYAKILLHLSLEECKKMGMQQVLITCDKTNIGSAKTILSNDGVLENEVILKNGTIKQRYWILIKE